MKKFVPLEKQSKKKQRAFYDGLRNTWGNLRPVTRVVRSKKNYDRSLMKEENRRLFRKEED